MSLGTDVFKLESVEASLEMNALPDKPGEVFGTGIEINKGKHKHLDIFMRLFFV